MSTKPTPPRPVRLRLSRAKGFNLQALSRATNGLPAVNCARPGKWGNQIGRSLSRDDAVRYFKAWLEQTDPGRNFAAVARRELCGKNLACWCPLHLPCHTDTLLEIANP